MKARGNTKKILQKVGRIQTLIGRASGSMNNDRQSDRMESVQKALSEAFDLCIEILGAYDRIPE